MVISEVKTLGKLSKKLRVCAYARVSNSKDTMLHSLSAQVQFYKQYILKNKRWLFYKVYYDEGISGTKVERPAFNEMMEEARLHKFDLIITKSISRFARNTVVLLETIRELKSLNIDVYFEEQNLHSLSKDGELMLTILASYAQEEARSVSENMKWRVKKNFKEGLVWGSLPYGYYQKNGKVLINNDEAEVIKYIFKSYDDDISPIEIKRALDKKGIKPRLGEKWSATTIRRILKNEIYIGNVTLQKTYIENYMTKKKRINKGKLPRYYVEDSHEPIVSKDLFERVNKKIASKLDDYNFDTSLKEKSLKGMVFCSHCGHRFQLKKNYKTYHWICGNYSNPNSSEVRCVNTRVRNEEMERLTKEVLGVDALTGALVHEQIEKIVVCDDNVLAFHLKDGQIVNKTWITKSRKESWTPEMKKEASEKGKERRNHNGKSNSNSINN